MSNGIGRPSIYTPELAAEICRRLAAGESLRAICRDDEMPERQTVQNWLVEDREGFFGHYAKARDVALDAMADEILEIADTPEIGVKTKTDADGKTETTEGDMIEHRRLRVDARKWYLSKLAPKRYGDKQALEVTGKDGGPVELDDKQAAARLAAILAAAQARKDADAR